MASKVVDSAQLNSDLTSIANAIRTKGSTSAALAFPDGFISAIENLSGGGSATLIEKSVNANGVYNASSDSADGYSKVTVSVPASAVDSGTKSITANGNNQDVVGYAAVNVAVPNTYAAGDEGKVVSNGALVSQTAHAEVTQNGTIDTTLNNSVTVNVSGSSGLVYEEGTYTAASDSNPNISFANAHTAPPAMVMFVDTSGTFPDSTNKGAACIFGNFDALVSGAVVDGDSTQKDGAYVAIYRGTGTSLAGAGGVRSPISSNVTSSGFTPFFGTSARTCISGRSYKWLAVWR